MARGEIKALVFADGVEVSASSAGPNYTALITDTTGWTGSQTTVTYDLVALGYDIDDSRSYIWQLQDLAANNYMQVLASIDFPSLTTVRVTVEIPLAVGTYRLLGR